MPSKLDGMPDCQSWSCHSLSAGMVLYLLLCGDVVVDEGHSLIGALAAHAGDAGHRHLAGLYGGLGAIATQLCFFL